MLKAGFPKRLLHSSVRMAMDQNRKSFCSSFFITLGVVLFWITLLEVFRQVYYFFVGRLAVDWASVFIYFFGFSLGIAVFILIAIAIYRVFTNEAGLCSYTLWGNYRTIPWNEIDFVRPINVLGLQYLRVGNINSGTKVWVPLFLSDMKGFKEEINRLAGPHHPLANALTGY